MDKSKFKPSSGETDAAARRSKNTRVKDPKEATLPGRIVLDLYPIFRDDSYLRYPNFKLETVSQKMLGVTKEGVHHTDIARLQQGSTTDRRRLLLYCFRVRGPLRSPSR